MLRGLGSEIDNRAEYALILLHLDIYPLLLFYVHSLIVFFFTEVVKMVNKFFENYRVYILTSVAYMGSLLFGT